ncbi:MAG: hypothetical protein IT328_16650 [Caldilineaceae bacterium]|nr:hypothetical protein [Caldilineaceae bacterium]
MMRWLLPVGLVMALAGYFAPWIAHPVAGLVITGLDLGEYVKFLPVVREGTVTIWRFGFYVPLVAVSAASLLVAYRGDFAYRWWLRLPLLALAAIAAFNLVPPAWTPARLLEPEFRLQTASLLGLLVGLAFSPFWALLPRPVAATLVTALTLTGCLAPLYDFYQVLPAIQALYHQPLAPAWGLWLMVLGLILIPIAYWFTPSRPSLPR